jgi:hypothetical protein
MLKQKPTVCCQRWLTHWLLELAWLLLVLVGDFAGDRPPDRRPAPGSGAALCSLRLQRAKISGLPQHKDPAACPARHARGNCGEAGRRAAPTGLQSCL